MTCSQNTSLSISRLTEARQWPRGNSYPDSWILLSCTQGHFVIMHAMMKHWHLYITVALLRGQKSPSHPSLICGPSRMAQWVRALVSRLSSSCGTHMVDKTDSRKLFFDLWEHIMSAATCMLAHVNTHAHTHTNTCKRLNYLCSWWQIRLKIPNSNLD